MAQPNAIPLPAIELSGFDTGFNEQELGAQTMIHRFAADVMRPLGQELDTLSADQAYAPGSPFWQFHEQLQTLDLGPDALQGLSPLEAARLDGIVAQEMAWGDAGLTVSGGVATLPLTMAMATGKQELIELCQGKLGCWVATQPDRGSDGLILYPAERFPGSGANKGNLQATFTGDDIVINGQSSAWVSNGPVAQVALLDTVADYGNGFFDENGNTFGCNVIVPLDLKGISRGKPLSKIGKRPLPQGEIYFDNVRVPKRFAIATRDDYDIKHATAWAHAGTHMGHIAAGLARAAFELALAYVHERKQGGTELANLQLTQYRLGGIAMKVEAIKAMARHVGQYTKVSPQPHPYFTASGKAFCCNELAYVVKESMALFGGNGLTQEYVIEKMFRDAQSMQIEDGENNVLQMHFGHLQSRLYREHA